MFLKLALAGLLVLDHLLFDFFDFFIELSGDLRRAHINLGAFLNECKVMMEGLLILLVFFFDGCFLDHLLAAILLVFALLSDADHFVLLALLLGQAYLDFLERLQLLLLLSDCLLGLLLLQLAGDHVRVTDEA